MLAGPNLVRLFRQSAVIPFLIVSQKLSSALIAAVLGLAWLVVGFSQKPAVATLSGEVSELFFSEVVEGSSYNKAVEIFNGTSLAVDLQSYTVEMYFNGNENAELRLNLAGSIGPGEVHVLAHARAENEILSIAQQQGEFGWFNGNDAVVLMRSGVPVDVVGRIGVDPGRQWGSGESSTADNTLRRLDAVCAGDSDGTDEFEPAQEWRGFSQDRVDGLGWHRTECAPGPYLVLEDEPLAQSEASGTTGVTPPPITAIYQVQGDDSASPLEGERVTVRGVVVGDFQEGDELSGFFIQELVGDDRSETSDGLFVYQRSSEVEVGEVVEVTAEVDEYHGLTQLTDVSSLQVVGREEPPEPVLVSLPLPGRSSWERYEGMLVTVESTDGSLAVSEVYHLGRGGLVLLADDPLTQFTQQHEPSAAGYSEHLEQITRRSIVLDDGSTVQNPDPIVYSATGDELTAADTLRVGDTTSSVTGILTYSYSGWRGTDANRIHPTQEVKFATANPRPPLPPEVGGTLQVASFNVLNFFNGDGEGGSFPTTRGAESRLELERQLDKLVSAIVPMDAEVLGFVEIENDGGPSSALAELVAALNAATGEESYDYIETGPLGRDEIRVALAYQPGSVRPVGSHRVLNSTLDDEIHARDPRFDDRRNRPALAQTFEEIETGARFTVMVNHLKSKGSACPGDGREPPDGQGNCSEVRLEAAAALADWAVELAQEAGDPDLLITGDLNSYAMEDPIRLLRRLGFIDLLGRNESTYVFAGEAGTLDYALVTPSLGRQVTGADVWHINTEEPSVLDYNSNFKSDRQVGLLYSSSPFRSSDHDPLIIGLELQQLD